MRLLTVDVSICCSGLDETLRLVSDAPGSGRSAVVLSGCDCALAGNYRMSTKISRNALCNACK